MFAPIFFIVFLITKKFGILEVLVHRLPQFSSDLSDIGLNVYNNIAHKIVGPEFWFFAFNFFMDF